MKHPHIPGGSVGWRMGDGEDYYNEFYRWFSTLPAADQDAFARVNPPPSEWRNLYETIKADPWF
jgi:hypothetical protein